MRRTWPRSTAVLLGVLAVSLAGCANSVTRTSTGGGAPGVSPTEIDVGSIADVTGPLSSDFGPVVNGVQAYFSMVNARGGVAGRMVKLADQSDDQGNATTDLTVAQKLVEQDHVFAVVGVGTPFFGGAGYLAEQGVPTFGYMVSSDWADKPTLFGTGGSVLAYSTAAAGDSYFAKQLGATSIAVVAYGVAQSAAACQAAASGMRSFGLNVSFTDFGFPFGSDPTADVLQMKAHNVDLMLSCLDVLGNVAYSKAITQNSLTMNQIWFNGYDRTTLQQYGPVMRGVHFALQRVPFEAAQAFPGAYPGLDTYIREMQRYQPAFTYDEVALDGWISAAQFVAGLRAVGRDLTQKKVVAAINAETAFTGGGLMPPVNWARAHSSAVPPPPPYCGASVAVVGGHFVASVVPGTHQVFVCFGTDNTTPVAPRPGTPGT